MVKISVWHDTRKSKVFLDMPEDIVEMAERGYKAKLMKILKAYKKKSNYVSFVNVNGLKFKRVNASADNNINISKKSSFHYTDSLQACNNPNCVDCENGYYKRCRYR